MGGGEEAKELTANLAVGRLRFDRLNRWRGISIALADDPTFIPLLHVRPFSVNNGRQVRVQIV